MSPRPTSAFRSANTLLPLALSCVLHSIQYLTTNALPFLDCRRGELYRDLHRSIVRPREALCERPNRAAEDRTGKCWLACHSRCQRSSNPNLDGELSSANIGNNLGGLRKPDHLCARNRARQSVRYTPNQAAVFAGYGRTSSTLQCKELMQLPPPVVLNGVFAH